ncbi:MAG: transcription termination/antitermination protein NusA [Alphaproteobacteria bacterium]|nr:transcription termination/antitermination protein NusA [Alphaproteobacteria bacterium]MBN2675307.1 transcription termination/antitermination protein NusA [Alphaproteobacteria bacterium]
MSFVSMPRQDLLLAIDSLAQEKQIERNIVIESLEAAIAKIAKHKYGEEFDITATIDRKNGAISVKRLFEVIESPESIGEEEYNSNTMLTISEAKKYSKDPQVGDIVEDQLPEPEFGRMAFQTAKQIMTARVRDAEKGHQFEEFKDNIGDIISGVVKRIEFGNVFVDINGKAEGYIKGTELIPGERLAAGDRVRALIMDVSRSNSGPQIFLTRTHPMFMEKLFVQEVPEIYEGVIKIKSVARAPGSHAKIAVQTEDPSIDAVGMTVGMKGTRIQPVINECHGEKIDVILYSEDPAAFIVNSMQPAKVAKIIVDEDTHTAAVVVNEDQQSLAIGRRGQNVRLASQLTGWNIDVMSEAQEQERRAKEFKEKTELFIKGLDVDEMIAHLLITEGFRTIEEVAFIDIAELQEIEGFNTELAGELQTRAKAYLEKVEQDYKDEGNKLGMKDDLLSFDFIKRPIIMKLGHAGIRSLEDLADLASDELVEILGEDIMSGRLAERVVMKAREIAYNIIQDEEE